MTTLKRVALGFAGAAVGSVIVELAMGPEAAWAVCGATIYVFSIRYAAGTP